MTRLDWALAAGSALSLLSALWHWLARQRVADSSDQADDADR